MSIENAINIGQASSEFSKEIAGTFEPGDTGSSAGCAVIFFCMTRGPVVAPYAEVSPATAFINSLFDW